MWHFSLKRSFVFLLLVLSILAITHGVTSNSPTRRPIEISPPPEVLSGALDNLASRDARRQCLYRTHDVQLVAGQAYVIEMTSGEFETFLMIEDPSGTLVATDDDCPTFRGSRITYRPNMTGEHRLIATTLAPSGRGTYMIAVTPREMSPEVLVDVRGFLSMSDPDVDGHHRRTYRVNLMAGQTYSFNLTSGVFDGSVRLERMDGAIVAFDEEGALGTNARFRFEAPEDCVYRVVVTSSAPRGAGPFALRICKE